jgi:hypothetical protein
MEAFSKVCEDATYRVRENPPAMDLIWESGVVEDLIKAASVALEAGAPPDAIYAAVESARPEVEFYPAKLEHMLMKAGLHPDTILGHSGCTLLMQKLCDPYPPPCVTLMLLLLLLLLVTGTQ